MGEGGSKQLRIPPGDGVGREYLICYIFFEGGGAWRRGGGVYLIKW